MRFRQLRIPYEACVALAECLQPHPLTADWGTWPHGNDPRYEGPHTPAMPATPPAPEAPPTPPVPPSVAAPPAPAIPPKPVIPPKPDRDPPGWTGNQSPEPPDRA